MLEPLEDVLAVVPPPAEAAVTSHLGIMILFAACVSTVFGTLFRDLPQEQIRLGARIFGTLVTVLKLFA